MEDEKKELIREKKYESKTGVICSMFYSGIVKLTNEV